MSVLGKLAGKHIVSIMVYASNDQLWRTQIVLCIINANKLATALIGYISNGRLVETMGDDSPYWM